MTTLTITSRGQVTLNKDILRHLGIPLGGKLDLIKLPGGRITLRAARRPGHIDDFIGILAGKSKKTASLAEIRKAISAGWAKRK